MVADVRAWRAGRDDGRGRRPRSTELRRAAIDGDNVMPATIALARAGGTTGEWGTVMREVFGEFRGPTGVGAGRRVERPASPPSPSGSRRCPAVRPGCWWPSPGLDGHSNGAEQIAVAARDAGMEVVYSGIRLDDRADRRRRRATRTPTSIGLSILSGSHLELVPDLVARLRARASTRRSSSAASSPRRTGRGSLAAGVAAVYTPKDFDIWPGSWARSPTWRSPTAPAERPRAAPPHAHYRLPGGTSRGSPNSGERPVSNDRRGRRGRPCRRRFADGGRR